ncbi:fasciclin domain-containing protein [Cellulophaga sp. F20128]|uniref:fasciclin domain-containing protein n=1 Tax=Cellulophaga sp. F20128 TaxID=2926413 RepID=UPI001FF18BE2|nr:fasciclin domain-containing protein [Cellulophaga sp. F20128]MCK0158380.1 fasciclin domain-containing protein [Cellulophaga sp. F20128]
MKKYILLIVVVTAIFIGCEKQDYLIDGGVHETGVVDMTTYEYLQTNAVFDTLLLLIDKAELKETINGDVTFFPPTDFSIKNYITKKYGDTIAQNAFVEWTMDDIPVQTLRDSLQMYIIPNKVNRDDLTEENQVFQTLLGNQVGVALIPVDDVYAGIVSTWPEYVFLTHIRGAGLDTPGTVPPEEEIDIRNVCQTSGIETNTGVIHVLENSHTMFYFVQTHFPEN